MLVIVDYHMGNLHSVKKKLDFLHVESVISSDPAVLLSASRLLLPGVGHFGRAMGNLRKLQMLEALNEAALVKKTPVLGICLGMQLMTKSSEEGSEEGLGWFNCQTERLKVRDPYHFKIPHTGWNTIDHNASSPILKDVDAGSEVYFVHAYGVNTAPADEVLTTTVYDQRFVSALQKQNIIGMQFHPEKSHDVGMQIFQNFLNLL